MELNTLPVPPAVIPVHTGNHLSAHTEPALEQKLTTVKRTQGHQTFADSEAVRPTHGACRIMGLRVRGDDEL